MQAIVMVSLRAARALHERSPPIEDAEDLPNVMEAFGLAMEPLHRSTDDPTLQKYFVVEVPDVETAQRLIERLQQSPLVEAAYIKPPDEMP